MHGFSNPADRPVRWLETQAPQPPARHSYRFTRDWDYLRDALASPERTKPCRSRDRSWWSGDLGLGLAVARHYAGQGREVVLSGRDQGRADAAAADVGGKARGSPSTWPSPPGWPTGWPASSGSGTWSWPRSSGTRTRSATSTWRARPGWPP